MQKKAALRSLRVTKRKRKYSHGITAKRRAKGQPKNVWRFFIAVQNVGNERPSHTIFISFFQSFSVAFIAFVWLLGVLSNRVNGTMSDICFYLSFSKANFSVFVWIWAFCWVLHCVGSLQRFMQTQNYAFQFFIYNWTVTIWVNDIIRNHHIVNETFYCFLFAHLQVLLLCRKSFYVLQPSKDLNSNEYDKSGHGRGESRNDDENEKKE